jgi:ABC-type branched-subunit amino acid transport system substrate-binding protein
MRKGFVIIASLLMSVASHAQLDTSKVHRIALFVPLYLDSAFDAGHNYRYGKTFPKQSLSGLEFYEGAEFAVDSLQKEGVKMELHVFDTRSKSSTIGLVSAIPIFDSVNLIIGSVTGNEYLQLASLAKQRNIPFISATYPNDGGVKDNPNVIIVNSKLNTHIQSVYNYILRNLGTGKIILFRRKDKSDDRVADVFKSLNNSPGGGVLTIQTVTLPDYFTLNDVKPYLDSVRQNTIIAGSLDENFGRNLAVAGLGLIKDYQINLVGMPTWDGIKDFNKPDYKLLPIIYSTTFYNPLLDKWSIAFEEAYKRKTYSRPSDMAFKGFEILYCFTKLLKKHDTAFVANLSDKSFRLLTEFDFKPINWSRTGVTPDYYENKRIYIIRRFNGLVTRLN